MGKTGSPQSLFMRLSTFVALLALALVVAVQAAPASLQSAAAQLSYEQVPLSAADAAAGDNFGYSVAIDGNTLVVGAYRANTGGKEKTGAAYVFTRPASGSKQWTQTTRLAADDGATFDQFGAAVAVSGDTIAVSAIHADINGNTNQGAVYLFGRNQGGANKWGQIKKITASDGDGLDEFGFALVLTGDELLVGTPAADANGYVRNGAVYVFRRDLGGAGNWGEAGLLFDPAGRDSDNFAYDLAVNGNWLVVGADRADVTGTYENDGAALLFNRAGPGADWTFVKRLVASDAKGSERFGAAVAISGDWVLVGAPAAGRNNQHSVGKAYLFGRDQGGAGNWGEIKILTDSAGGSFDSYGATVALDGDTAFVAAREADVSLVDEGAIFVYRRDQGGANNWGQAQKLWATGGAPNDNFGVDIAYGGEALLVGANLADSAKGRAYVYTAAPPPQQSSILLPAIYDQSFTATATLSNGGVVTTPEGVKLGAVAGALTSPLPVSIGKVPPPGEPVPAPLAVAGDFYRIAAARDAVQPLDRGFILGLPVPQGIPTGNLGVAVYGSTESILDMELPPRDFWSFAPGIYDAANGLLLVQFPYLAQEGETVALASHPDLASAVGGGGVAGRGATAGNFTVMCLFSITCPDGLVDEFANELQKNFADFMFNHGYGYPRMQGNDSNTSIDPPQLNVPSDTFYAYIIEDSETTCADGKLGAYRYSSGFFYICVPDGTVSLSDEMKDTIRHEYFHALQYNYDNTLADKANGRQENWITEGMAEAVVKSGSDWKRSELYDIRPVDKGLRDNSGDLPYQAQDLWVYYGRHYSQGGIGRLRPILDRGVTIDAVTASIDFDKIYWMWVRNQVLEKSDNLDNALVEGMCRLEEKAAPLLYTWEFPQNPPVNPLVGGLFPLSSYVVEIEFSDYWNGVELNIMVDALPEDQPPPEGFAYKIYRSPWPNCSSTPDNTHQKYEIFSGERYFVVFANSSKDEVIPWQIVIE